MSRILLIEDSPTQAQRFALMLRSSGFEVEQASCLEEGLRRVQEGGIDALLLDLTLPDSEGLKTVLTARAAAPHMPLVVLTSLDDESVAEAALQQGAQDYLVKSEVNQSWLARSVQHAITRGASRRAEGAAPHKAEAKARQLLDITTKGGVSVVRFLDSRLLDAADIALIAEKLTRLVDSGCRKMLITFSNVDYVANGALSALLAVRRKMLLADGTLRLSDLSSNVLEHLCCRQFHKLFDIRDSEQSALASFGPPEGN